MACQVQRTICRTNSRLCFTPDGKTILAGGGIPVMDRLPAFPNHRVGTMAVWQYGALVLWWQRTSGRRSYPRTVATSDPVWCDLRGFRYKRRAMIPCLSGNVPFLT